jgi:hypothetical protein
MTLQASRKVLSLERILLASTSWHHEVKILKELQVLTLNFDELFVGFHVTFNSCYWELRTKLR